MQAVSPEPALDDPPWSPDLFEKQYDLINDRHRRLLVSGPFKTGKSWAICHKIVRHLWEVNGAYVGIFVTSYKVGTDGSWADLTKFVIPEWIAAGIEGEAGPMSYTTFVRGEEEGGPKLDSKSRAPFFKIRNMFGGESECRLYSIDNENEIEAKVKQLRFSAVWVVELSTFKSKKIMDLTVARLRAVGVPFEDHFWIADTNPAEEGKEHWAYKVFYKDRIDPAYPDKEFQQQTGLMEFFLNDNTRLDPRERRELENIYRDSPEEFARFVEGTWPEGSSRRRELFGDIITPAHFVDGPIDVGRSSHLLITGWDMGGINSAFVIVEKRIVDGITYWMALDEVVLINTEISTANFTLRCLERMIVINEFYKDQWKPLFPGFDWVHWSDNSSTNVYRPQLDSVDAAEVYRASNGQIELQGVMKPNNSVEEGVKMIRTLIREGRLFIGGNCPHLKRAMLEIKRGSRWTINPDDPLKHVLDAFRYAIWGEWMEDFAQSKKDNSTSHLIHIPL